MMIQFPLLKLLSAIKWSWIPKKETEMRQRHREREKERETERFQ